MVINDGRLHCLSIGAPSLALSLDRYRAARADNCLAHDHQNDSLRRPQCPLEQQYKILHCNQIYTARFRVHGAPTSRVGR
jgi:hypothetical protein